MSQSEPEKQGTTTRLRVGTGSRLIPLAVVGLVGLAGVAAWLGQPRLVDLCVAEVAFIGNAAWGKPKQVVDDDDDDEDDEEEVEEVAQQPVEAKEPVVAPVKEEVKFEEISIKKPIKDEDAEATPVAMPIDEPTLTSGADTPVIEKVTEVSIDDADFSVSSSERGDSELVAERVDYTCRPTTPSSQKVLNFKETIASTPKPERRHSFPSNLAPELAAGQVDLAQSRSTPPSPPVSPPRYAYSLRTESDKTRLPLPRFDSSLITPPQSPEQVRNAPASVEKPQRDLSHVKIDEDWQHESANDSDSDRRSESEEESEELEQRHEQEILMDQIREALEEDTPDVHHVEDVAKHADNVPGPLDVTEKAAQDEDEPFTTITAATVPSIEVTQPEEFLTAIKQDEMPTFAKALTNENNSKESLIETQSKAIYSSDDDVKEEFKEEQKPQVESPAEKKVEEKPEVESPETEAEELPRSGASTPITNENSGFLEGSGFVVPYPSHGEAIDVDSMYDQSLYSRDSNASESTVDDGDDDDDVVTDFNIGGSYYTSLHPHPKTEASTVESPTTPEFNRASSEPVITISQRPSSPTRTNTTPLAPAQGENAMIADENKEVLLQDARSSSSSHSRPHTGGSADSGNSGDLKGAGAGARQPSDRIKTWLKRRVSVMPKGKKAQEEDARLGVMERPKESIAEKAKRTFSGAVTGSTMTSRTFSGKF